MQIQSRHFGVLEVDDDKILGFPKGIIGMPHARRFCLLNLPEIQPYQYLHCVDDPQLAFLVVPVVFVKPDYQLKINDQDRADLKFGPEDQPLALGIVVLPDDPAQATVDLLAPVLINESGKIGGQVINDVRDYRVRHRIREDSHNAREGEHHAGADAQKETITDARR